MARRVSEQTLIGLLLAVIGVVLVLDTTDLYDVTFLLDFIPTAVALVGVYALVKSGFRNLLGPLVVIAVGVAWQLVVLDLVPVDDAWSLWPLVLVVAGIALVAGRFRRRPSEVAGERVSAVAVFGGREQRVTSTAFHEAEVTVLFGGAELDLRDAGVADPPAEVSVFALFGGAELIVPREWNVRLDVLPVLGAAEDERPRRERDHEEVDLVVRGFVMFGGVSVSD